MLMKSLITREWIYKLVNWNFDEKWDIDCGRQNNDSPKCPTLSKKAIQIIIQCDTNDVKYAWKKDLSFMVGSERTRAIVNDLTYTE